MALTQNMEQETSHRQRDDKRQLNFYYIKHLSVCFASIHCGFRDISEFICCNSV